MESEKKRKFVRSEGAALRRYMDKHVIEDMLAPPGAQASYSRNYTCDCGFVTCDSGEIYDHAASCKGLDS